MATVAVILAEGFEEIEALTPVDVLRRANVVCDMIGLTDQKVTGSHAIPVLADKVFDGDLSAYEMIVLPGGLPGAHHLRDHEGLIAALQKEAAAGKYVAAICAAPSLLGKLGLLKGKEAISYPGFEENLLGAKISDKTVVKSGNIITAKAPGVAIPFALKIVETLKGKEVADKVAGEIYFEK